MSSQRGFILVLSYLFLTFLVMWAAVGFGRSATELDASERYTGTSQGFHIAEAALDDGARWLQGLPAPPSGTLSFDACVNGVPPLCAACPCQLNGVSYTVTVDPDDNNPTSFLDLYTVTATSTSSGLQSSRRILGILQTESFARYSYFTNYEEMSSGTNIWFTTRDHLQGPVHSNDQFNIAGNPIFDGLLSSANSAINYKNPPPTGGNNPQFNGGLSLGADAISLPLSSTQLRVAAASASGNWFSGNTAIALQSNGTMLVTNAAMGWANEPRPLPVNGALFVNGGNVTVSGTLDGQLTIGASDDVIVTNNVTCAVDPKTNPSSDDILGLVAERNVVISQAAPFDLTIQASVTALASSFTVENWWVGPPKGDLHIYGGIIQDRRGPVGTFNSSTGDKVSGYSKDYQYDSRFSSTAPPFYPTTGDYNEVLWQEN